MSVRSAVLLSGLACLVSGAAHARASGAEIPVLGPAVQTSKLTPGVSRKDDVRRQLGEPWREVRFNDCGHPPSDHNRETWEYRGLTDAGGYLLHIEFDELGLTTLVVQIPDVPANTLNGARARVAPPAAGGQHQHRHASGG